MGNQWNINRKEGNEDFNSYPIERNVIQLENKGNYDIANPQRNITRK